jgi:hypothetical protein
VLYSGLKVYVSEISEKSKLGKLYAKVERFTFQFPNSDAERTSVNAPSSPWPCPPGPYRGLQWGQLKVYVSAIFEIEARKNYTPKSMTYLPISKQRR